MASRLAFVADYLDPNSGVLWKYQVFFHPDTQEVEMFDIKNRRHFLKKVKCGDLNSEMFYVGGTVTVFSRQLKLIDYNDEYTRNLLEGRSQRTLAMVKPDAFKHLGKIVHAIQQSGFLISNMRVCKLTKAEAVKFYEVHEGKPFFDALTDFMSSGRICALELVAPGAIKKWRDLLGPTDSNRARLESPHSIRAVFGTDTTRNACHGSDAPETAQEEAAFFFKSSIVGRCDVRRNTTLGVIKPHAIRDKVAGLILDIVQEHFDITALRMVNLDKQCTSEFLEVYKGVLPPAEYSSMIEELSTGPCIAIEAADKLGAEPVAAFRQLCGPVDPEIGRVLRPHSIRAQFGVDRVKNAIHCTDLLDDGELETNYFFSVLQK